MKWVVVSWISMFVSLTSLSRLDPHYGFGRYVYIAHIVWLILNVLAVMTVTMWRTLQR